MCFGSKPQGESRSEQWQREMGIHYSCGHHGSKSVSTLLKMTAEQMCIMYDKCCVILRRGAQSMVNLVK